jgi:DNA ligase-1
MIHPMLCRTWEDAPPHPNQYPVYVQPKLDGIRCIVTLTKTHLGRELEAHSRGGKPLVLPFHIERSLIDFYTNEKNWNVVLDGELYAHGLSFQEVASRIKRVKHGTHPDVAVIRYAVYDIVEENMTYAHRKEWLDRAIPNQDGEKDPVYHLLAFYSADENDVSLYHDWCVDNGFEGSIIRLPGGKYEQGKRSKNLLKRKDWKDEDFEIVNVEEGVGKNSGTAVLRLEIPLKDGECRDGFAVQQFTVTAPGNYTEKAAVWDHRDEILATAHVCTVKYQELTDDGIPRFPVALGIKEKGT